MGDSGFSNKNIDRKPVRIALNDSRYPDRVKVIMGRKAPEHLDMVGNLNLLKTPGIGFCGSRKASEKGLGTAKDCAEQAAQHNISVISGNAAGVDFQAHFNSLKAGGKTILILPEGINHFRIKKAFAPVWDWNRVLVISQLKPDDPWRPFRAMTRNQLIIALSRVMIVIEAGEKGGTINAGEETLKSGIPLFVVQYQDMSNGAYGNQLLLNMGAQKLVKSRTRERANLDSVFEKVEENQFLKNLPRQQELLQAEN